MSSSSLYSSLHFRQWRSAPWSELKFLHYHTSFGKIGPPMYWNFFYSHLQVNYLSHFLLILHLLPVMRESGADCRIVSVSSMGHVRGKFDLSNIQAQKKYENDLFYSDSKLFQVRKIFFMIFLADLSTERTVR